jgi:hypothetical protein
MGDWMGMQQWWDETDAGKKPFCLPKIPHGLASNRTWAVEGIETGD